MSTIFFVFSFFQIEEAEELSSNRHFGENCYVPEPDETAME
jgi:hypothetical protein